MVDFEKFTKLEGNRTNHAAIVVSKIIKNKIGRILLIRLLIKFEKLKVLVFKSINIIVVIR